MNIETFGFGDQFTLNDAFELLNCHVVKKGDEKKSESTIEVIGFVAGVITLNDEIEVMIKFPKELVQLTKSGFSDNITLLEMT
ncbi:hypothetical protein NBRC116592_35830 [Colwellia sp. KU-HH00111]|uniref:hypothetical protein n=1 Tax=Colwellia sp. KU-HH00111 TaxID=3127652 RepID=UPI00310BB456